MDRIQVGAIQINNINPNSALKYIADILATKNTTNRYICLPDGYVLALSNKSKKLQSILNNSAATFPDGKILEKVAHLKGFKSVSTVSGYYLLEHFIGKPEISHFFYGGSNESVRALIAEIKRKHKKPNISGYKSPPFVQLEEIENNEAIQEDVINIKDLKPDIVWIGISSPKQDFLMADICKHMPNALLIGVGAVFDYYSGRVKKSPEWIKKIGLRWLYRLIKEPKRMFNKEFVTLKYGIPFFIRQLFVNNQR